MNAYDADGYIHLLFYYDEGEIKPALDFVQATYDRDAEDDECADVESPPYVLIFRTDNALSLDQRRVLLRVTNPDEHDLNNY